MKGNTILFFILASVFFIILGYGFISKRPIVTPPPVSPTSSIAQPTAITSNEVNEKIASLQRGGNNYADPEGVYMFLYPNDYKIDGQNNGQITRIYKTGPTQQGQTEIYDGVIMTFEAISLRGQTLEEWVDNQIKTTTADGTSTLESPKHAVTINGHTGFTYTARGLGTSTYLYLQKDPSSPYAVGVTYLVADPTNAGFQNEVDAILSTLVFQK